MMTTTRDGPGHGGGVAGVEVVGRGLQLARGDEAARQQVVAPHLSSAHEASQGGWVRQGVKAEPDSLART